ncbi:hypothetical protein ABT160_46375 [Streptomyces sp. NPDC001941]|uniref:hypothetical protein n=1 Tax=Streptomyces sp. NPDC001941 TaxID=3154659 RepID=UPI0033321C54
MGVFGSGVAIMTLVSVAMFIRYDGLSVDLAKSVGLLVLFLALLMLVSRQATGRWFTWSRR